MRIVFTGGHHNSALEVAVEARNKFSADIIWFGHKHTSLKDKNVSAEYTEVVKENIPFIDIKAGKIFKTTNPLHWLRVPYGFLQALLYLVKYRPKLIVSFGGYIAVPVVIVGFFLGIPSITHEQTTVVGWANKVISQFAKKICITWPSSSHYFPQNKTVLVGLPLRKAIFEKRTDSFDFPNSLPTLFITAGKQGSHVINQAVQSIIPRLLSQFNLIHQCGSHSEFDDYTALQAEKAKLSAELQNRYILREYVYQDEVGAAFSKADILILRAGAHTIYEVAALGKPAIMIPIPWVSHNEQFKNAEVIASHGGGVILEQSDLSGETLLAKITEIYDDCETYKKRSANLKSLVQFDAVEKMMQQIGQFVQ